MKTAFIHVTNSCNLNCFHCAYSSGVRYQSELPLSEIENVAKLIQLNGGTSIMLGGGEPLLRPDIDDILDMLGSCHLAIKLETNLTANTATILKLPGYANLTVITSIDSMNPSIHDRQRGLPGSFDRTLEHIMYLRRENVPVRINALMLQTNKNEIAKYLAFSEQTGATYRPLFRLIDTGRCLETGASSLRLSPYEINEILTVMFSFARFGGNRRLLSFYLPPALMPPDLVETPCLCDWGNFIGVAADGTVALCPAALGIKEFTGGRIEEYTGGIKKFSDIAYVRLSRDLETLALEGVCGQCAVRGLCRGGCRVDAYVRYKSVRGPDPICQAYYDSGLFPEFLIDVEA